MKTLGKVLVGVIVLLVAAVVALVVVISSTDFNEYKDLLAREVKKATGRDVVISGDLDLTVSLTPSLSSSGVRFGNAPWGSRPDMVSVERFEARVELLPLVSSREIRVTKVVLIGADILLETDAKGRGNWILDTPQGATSSGQGASDSKAASAAHSGDGAQVLPVVYDLEIRDSRLTYRDGQTQQTTELTIVSLESGAQNVTSPLGFDLRGMLDGKEFTASGETLPLADLAKGAKSLPVTITAAAGGAKAQIKGTVDISGAAPRTDLTFAISGDNIAQLFSFAGMETPLIGAYGVAGTLNSQDQEITLGDLSAKLANSDVRGTVKVNLANKRPRIIAKLSSQQLRKADFSPADDAQDNQAATATGTTATAAGSGGTTSGRIFSSEPLALDGLRAIDATFDYTVANLDLDKITVSAVTLKGALEKGRLTLDSWSAKVGEGGLGGALLLDASTANPALRAKVSGQRLPLGVLLQQVAGHDILAGGATEATIDLTSRGNSVAALMAGLTGNLSIQVGEGKINNQYLDLAGADLLMELTTALNPLVKKEPVTALQCAVVRFPVKDGIATIDKGVALETAKMTVAGSGKIDLAAETLNMAVETAPRGGIGLSVGGLASLVRLQGPLAAPGVKIDPVGVGKAALEVGAAAATGGLSVLGKALLNSSTGDAEPCRTALGLPPTKAPPPAAEPTPAPTVKQVTTQVEEKVQKKVEQVQEKASQELQKVLPKTQADNLGDALGKQLNKGLGKLFGN